MKIAVIGAGSWGTTLANLLAQAGNQVHLWVREAELLNEIKTKGENTWFLPGIALCPSLKTDSDLEKVLHKASCFLLAVPCQYLRSVLEQAQSLFPRNPVLVCASKGIELSSLKPMSQVVKDTLSSLEPRYAILSGPSFAREVSQGLPTAVSLGCADKNLGQELQAILSTKTFRVYTNPDVQGVELGGAIKNIMAIASGISDGLNFGHDARAALITRGLAEMSRLGVSLGAQAKTFMGLSGMGDLVLTCTGDLSRNRRVGLELGQGQNLEQIVSQMKMVAEGVKTTEAVHNLSKDLQVELPITEQVYRMLYSGKDPLQAVTELMCRELKEE